jgi:hypothetical protein
MSARIGLGVGGTAIRAVLVRGERIVWSHETAIAEPAELRAAIVHTLRRLPRQRVRKRQLLAAIGPSLSQLKNLGAFPAASDRLLADAVTSNAGRFFLRNGIPLRVTRLRRDAKEHAWIAAMEAPVVDAIEDACRELGIQYHGAIPTVAVLHHALRLTDPRQQIIWADADVASEAAYERGRLQSAVRRSRDEIDGHQAKLVKSLENHGKAWEFADAYAVTRADRRDPLLLRPATDAAKTRRLRIIRRSLLAGLCAASALAALFGPGLHAARTGSVAAKQLSQLATAQREIAVAQQALTRATHAIERGAGFADDRVSMTKLLASMSEAVPPMTAILNLRIDSTGGSLTALSPHGAEVFAAVSQLPGVRGALITAPLTRETLEQTELERVAIRFQFPKSSSKVSSQGPKGTRP